MDLLEKAKKGLKCCSAAKADSVCFESECPYKNHDERSENCCIDEMLDNGLEVIEELEKTVEDQAERIAIMEAEMLGWIDISEQQPTEDDRDILVISEGEVCFCTHYFSNNKHEYETPDIFESFPITHITHWMRLPKPPKEGGGN